MNQGEIQVVFIANAAQLKKAFSDVQSDSKKLAGNLDKTTAQTEAATKRLEDRFSGLRTTIKLAFATAATASLGFLGAMVKQASELQSQRASFESLTGSVKATDKVMSSLFNFSLNTAFSAQDINDAGRAYLAAGADANSLGKLLSETGDIAGATGANLGQLTLPLTQAMARGKLQTQDFYQILNSGAGAFRKNLEEEVTKRGLGNLQDAMAKGAVTWDIVTAAMEDATKKGGFAFQGAIKQAETFNGRMSNLKEAVSNVGLQILGVDKLTGKVKKGGLFDQLSTAVLNLTNYLNKNKDAIAGFFDGLIKNGPKILSIAAGVAGAFASMRIAGFVSDMVTANKTLSVFVGEKNANGIKSLGKAFSFFAKNPIIAIVAALAAAFVALGIKTGLFKQIWDQLQPSINQLMTALQPLLPIFAQLATQLVTALMPVVQALAPIFVSLVQALLPLIPPIAQLIATILPPLVQLLGVLVTALVPVIQLIGTMLVGAIKLITPILVPVIQIIGVALVGAINIAIGIIKTIISVIGSVIKWFGSMASSIGSAVSGAWRAVSNAFTNIKNFVSSAIGNVVSFVAGLPGRILRGLGNLGSLLLNAGKNLISGLVNGIGNAAHMVVDKIKSICSGALDAVKHFFGIHSPSTVMASMGDFLGQGLARGILGSTGTVLKAVDSMSQNVTGSFNATLQPSFAGASSPSMSADDIWGTPGSSTGGAAGGQIVQQNYLTNGVTVDQVNRSLVTQLRRA